jgi:hypothetical protein
VPQASAESAYPNVQNQLDCCYVRDQWLRDLALPLFASMTLIKYWSGCARKDMHQTLGAKRNYLTTYKTAVLFNMPGIF